ncbi:MULTISPECIES: 5'-nucleotidase C-terminal domain-containing protein [unclassified Flavobacterium]|uniref:5'-nucleotidase C-terminal domain-containing protein n=1 Tax=unclassified Flavobacterium TaxID=196869 RepID=UPI003F91DF20
MVNLKKYNDVFKLFVIFLTLFFISSCGNKILTVTKIEGKQLPITANYEQVASIENFIKPYREHINNDLDSILAYCPVTLDKKAVNMQSTMGNFMSDVVLQFGNKVFQKRENKTIDICLLNEGGIRAILPKGNVTARNGFEIMPFENNMVVIALRGKYIQDIIDYFITQKQAHPLSGLTFTIDKNKTAKNILVQGKPIVSDNIYYVGTNDYLANGGDNMNFFSKGEKTYDLDYKLRNILIDYFKSVDTVTAKQDNRIIVE